MSRSIGIVEIEAAINYWRGRCPSPDGFTLAPELRDLARVYALMAFHHENQAAVEGFPEKAMEAIEVWRKHA